MTFYVKKSKFFSAAGRAAAFLVFICLIFAGCGEKSTAFESLETETAAEIESETETSVNSDTIYIHVCGSVNNPGVYELSAGSRAFEAVAAAGGFSEDAAEDYLDMAEVLEDGMRLYVYSLQEAADADGPSGQTEADDGLVDINTADVSELMTLPGIGETRAQAIIDYRNEHGSFASVTDLMNVSGIKEATYEKLKDLIKAG